MLVFMNVKGYFALIWLLYVSVLYFGGKTVLNIPAEFHLNPGAFPQAARLAQSVEHETLNLRVVGSSPTLGEKILFVRLNFQFI